MKENLAMQAAGDLGDGGDNENAREIGDEHDVASMEIAGSEDEATVGGAATLRQRVPRQCDDVEGVTGGRRWRVGRNR